MLGGRAQGAEGEGEEGMIEITKELLADLRKKAEAVSTGNGFRLGPDVQGQAFIAVANPAVVLALLDALQEAEQEVGRLRTTIDKDTDVVAVALSREATNEHP
jgi:hypothetical protein